VTAPLCALHQVAYGIVKDTPELNELCSGVTNEQAFIQALAEHFLKEPALTARRETYENLGLPPPDETGACACAARTSLRLLRLRSFPVSLLDVSFLPHVSLTARRRVADLEDCRQVGGVGRQCGCISIAPARDAKSVQYNVSRRSAAARRLPHPQ
jgi:hypothetical protein